jgi:hypothetical protein
MSRIETTLQCALPHERILLAEDGTIRQDLSLKQVAHLIHEA